MNWINRTLICLIDCKKKKKNNNSTIENSNVKKKKKEKIKGKKTMISLVT